VNNPLVIAVGGAGEWVLAAGPCLHHDSLGRSWHAPFEPYDPALHPPLRPGCRTTLAGQVIRVTCRQPEPPQPPCPPLPG
jgi:hypothetical protein